MKGLGGLMKQAQKMQEQMTKAQEEMHKLEVEGQAGGGMVKIIMNGKHQVRKVDIDKVLLTDDQDMLEDLVAAAINDAVNKVEQEVKDKFADIAGGMNLPGGMQMPF